MSFFRVLLALLISAGIAYGLYIAVDESRFDRAVETVEAVRTEIVSRTGAVLDEAVEEEPAEQETETPVEVPARGEALLEAPTQGETLVMERAEPAAPIGEASDTATVADDAETAEAEETTAPAQTVTEAETMGFAARVEQDAAATEADEATGTVGQDGAETADETETAARDASETVGENDVPRIAAMPAPPETVLPDDAQAPDAQEALPTVRIADATETSTDALGVVSGGMNYAEARETLIEAGWSPRLPVIRTGEPSETETAMVEAGYGELEGCNDAERPICRFEFVDGEKRIAAVLTAGTGTDPSVIDAFLMDIRAE